MKKDAREDDSDVFSKTHEIHILGSDRVEKVSVNQFLAYICHKSRSGMSPGLADVARFIKVCQALGCDPWIGDAILVAYESPNEIKWEVIVTVHALLKRAESYPGFDGIESGVIVAVGEKKELQYQDGGFYKRDYGGELVGGWAKVYRKDRRVPYFASVSLDSYKRGHGRWAIDAGGMIEKVAKVHALRSAFPVAGVYLAEEISASMASRDRSRSNPVSTGSQVIDAIPKSDYTEFMEAIENSSEDSMEDLMQRIDQSDLTDSEKASLVKSAKDKVAMLLAVHS